MTRDETKAVKFTALDKAALKDVKFRYAKLRSDNLKLETWAESPLQSVISRLKPAQASFIYLYKGVH